MDEPIVFNAAADTIKPIVPDLDSYNPHGTLYQQYSLVASRMAGWHAKGTDLQLTGNEWHLCKTIKAIAAQVTGDSFHDVSGIAVKETERPVNVYSAAPAAVGTFGGPTARPWVLRNLLD